MARRRPEPAALPFLFTAWWEHDGHTAAELHRFGTLAEAQQVWLDMREQPGSWVPPGAAPAGLSNIQLPTGHPWLRHYDAGRDSVLVVEDHDLTGGQQPTAACRHGRRLDEDCVDCDHAVDAGAPTPGQRMPLRTFPADFPGSCKRCGAAIVRDDPIALDPTLDGAVCAACARTPSIAPTHP